FRRSFAGVRRTGGCRPRDDDEPPPVLAETAGPQRLECLGVVDVDGGAGGVDVQLPPVRARRESHAWPAGELCALGDSSPLEVEGPELVVAHLLAEAIAAPPTGREAEVHRLARA